MRTESTQAVVWRSGQRDASRLQRSAVLSTATTTAHALGDRSGSLDSALKRARCRRKLARKGARKRPLFPRAGGAPRAVLIEVQRALSTSAPTAPVPHKRSAIAAACSRSYQRAAPSAVLCFRYPALLTMPELRALYPIPYVRALLHVVLVAAFVLGVISVCLRRRKTLGAAGIAFTLIAAMLGGSRVPVDGEIRSGPFLGVDWFLLNVIVYSAVFIPLERFFALRPDQPVFRREWRTDLAYFFVSSLLVQVITLLTLKPAMVLFDWARTPALAAQVAALPAPAQFAAILVATDLTQYWIHRAFHRVPALWRFHAVHHSAETMDWLAGSRLHLVDVAVTRGLTYVPIYVFVAVGHAAVPSLAPRGGPGRGGQELRRPPAGSRPAVRLVPCARRPVARRVRHRGRRAGAGRIRKPVRPSLPQA